MWFTVCLIAVVVQLVMLGFLVDDQWKRKPWREDLVPALFGFFFGLACFGCSLAVCVYALIAAYYA